ncbi:MAG: histidine kinase [Bacteroidota bacterium]|nr:histidine kinase [Bacteroidota bacterium]
MTRNSSRYYWLCQLSGWGFVALVALGYNATTLEQRISGRLVGGLSIMVFTGILTTHLFREVMRRSGWLMLSVERALPKLLIGILITCIADTLIRIGLVDFFKLSVSKNKMDFTPRFLFITFDAGMVITPWTIIYYFYHYIEKSRKQQLDTLKLEALVKELELKTIKSHINPHFIFNALNSIRALVDENPVRARTAITELSNILRSSMQAEKLETVTFEKELNLVKDYLALEYIRFEERLRIEFEIDEETLDQPIPPMMLQTLVENAIKHGISKQVNGGKVKIVSGFCDDYHQLVIQNTGFLNGGLNGDGFGLASTKNRLQLLFGTRANFHIREINGDTVEAKVQIPIDASK